MPRDFIPRRDVDFLAFSADFSAMISATPADFGLAPPQAAHYAMTQQAFADAFETASAPSTRTTPAVTAKNDARQTLEDETRTLAAVIRSFPDITDAQLSDLNLNVPVEKRRRVPVPSVAPRVQIEEHGTNRQVWLAAAWVNPRSERGPYSPPVCTYASHGGPIMQAGALPAIVAQETPAPLSLRLNVDESDAAPGVRDAA